MSFTRKNPKKNERSPRDVALVYDDSEHAEANAALIAAAPDLLDACKAWEAARRDGGISHADLYAHADKLIRAAIAKAEGRAE